MLEMVGVEEFPVAVADHVHQLVPEADREEGPDAGEQDHRPVGIGIEQDLREQARQDRGVVILRREAERCHIDEDGDDPHRHLRDDHADLEQEPEREIEQKTRIRHRRTEHEKAPGQQRRDPAGRKVKLISEIAEIAEQDQQQQHKLDHQLTPGPHRR